MQPMSRTERAALCNSALEAGEKAPTLCGDWTVKDLVIHLLVRERDPIGAPGILLPPLSRLTDRRERRLHDQDFTALVERVRGGPPVWSPFALRPLDRVVNTLEYFVHHEDIRRGSPGWAPRDLTAREQTILWKMIGTAGRGLVRGAGVPVEARWGERRTTLAGGADPVVLEGTPAEITLYVFGRDEVHDLAVTGPADRAERLRTKRGGL